MGKRKSDNPLSILIVGMLLIGGFGTCVVFLNDKTPILKLRPLLVEEFKTPGLVARFRAARPGTQAAIVIELKEDDFSAERYAELADWALRRYVELVMNSKTKRTSVVQCEVQVKGDAQPRYVLRRSLLKLRDAAEADVAGLTKRLEASGLRDVKIEVGTYTETGVVVEVRGTATKRRTASLARQVLRALSSRHYTGWSRVVINGKHTLTGGRDPQPSAGVAPVTSG